MKTIEQHLREALTPEQFAKAEKYRAACWKEKVESPRRAMLQAFDWSTTNEPVGYWTDIYHNI